MMNIKNKENPLHLKSGENIAQLEAVLKSLFNPADRSKDHFHVIFVGLVFEQEWCHLLHHRSRLDSRDSKGVRKDVRKGAQSLRQDLRNIYVNIH